MKHWKTYLLIVIALIVISAAGYFGFISENDRREMTQQLPVPTEEYDTVAVTRGEVNSTIIAPGWLVNYQTVDIASRTNGVIQEVYVRPGDPVKAGDVIARLEGITEAEFGVWEAQVALDALYENAPLKEAEAFQQTVQAQENVNEAQYRVNSLYTPTNEVTLTEARARLTIAQQALTEAEKTYEPFRDKPDSDTQKAYMSEMWARAQREYNNALRNYNYLTGEPNELTRSQEETDLAIAQAELEIAQAAYDRLEDGIDPLELAKAQYALTQAQELLNALTITAPMDGVILSISVNTGQLVGEGSTILQMANPHALEVLVSVIEEDYPLVEVGQSVKLYFDAVPEIEATGRVERIIPMRSSGDRPLYQVYLSIDVVPDELVEGMTADSEIILQQKEDVLRLPRAIVQAKSDSTATVEIWENGQIKKRNITVGLRGDTYVEILSGLEEGEQVVTE